VSQSNRSVQYPRVARVGLVMIGLLAIFTALISWRDYRGDARISGNRLANLAATESTSLERYIQARFQILGALASGSNFRDGDADAIDRDLAAVNAVERGFDGGMLWTDTSGIIQASSQGDDGGRGMDVSDRQYVKDLLATGEPSVQAVIGRLNALPVVVLAIPTHDRSGEINGILLGIFRQQALAAQLTGFTGGTEDVVVIDDVANIVVGGRAGTLDRINPASPYGVIRYRQRGVLSSGVGLTGRRDQVIGFAIVPSLDWIVAVSDDRGAVLRPARRSFAQKLAILAGVVTLALAAMAWELRRARRMRTVADERRLASSRQRIAASRFMVANNPATVARTVCHAVEDELALPWCAIVSAMPDAPTRVLATSGDVPAWVDRVEIDLSEIPAIVRGEAARLTPIHPDGAGDDVEVRAARIGIGSTSGTRVLLAPYGSDLDEGQRASVSGILESATQAFDRAYLMERDRRAQERANLLTRVTSEVNDVDGVAARTRRLVEMVVPEWADAAVVLSVTEPFRTVAARHRVPGRLSDVIAKAEDALAEMVSQHEIRPRRRARRATARSLVEALAADRAVLVEGQSATVIAVPLHPGDETEAVLLLWRETGRPPFDADNLEFAELLADRAAIAIARARRFAHERQVALELQRSLLPESESEFSDRVRVATRYLPGTRDLNVGGDWFDASERRDGRLALVVGDVVGHGLQSAAAMGRLASALRALAISEDSPEATLDALEDFASRTSGAMLATVAFLVLDAGTGELEYCVAGHPPPLVVHPDGSTEFLWEGRRTPLGVSLPGEDDGLGRTVLNEGDTVILYSDGVVERRGELIDTSLERLARTARANRDLGPESMVDAVLDEMLGAVTQSDDAAMLVARIDHLGRRLRFSFQPTPGALVSARRRVNGWLADTAPADTVAIRLAVGAALSNLTGCGGDDDGMLITVELAQDRDGEITARVGRRGGDVTGAFDEDGHAVEIIRGLMTDVRIERQDEQVDVDMRSPVAGATPVS